MKIVRLEAENIKRLSAVEIEPNGAPVVVIAGENEAGKSSVLDAIAMALGGKALIPTKPIRDGQDRASVTVDLGDYIVTRTFTKSGSSLTVSNRDGLKFPSPQAMLDGIVGRLTFDPLAFAEMDAEAQAQTLRRLAGLNTDDLDAAYQKTYDERTAVNREEKTLKAAAERAPSYPDAGTVLEASAGITEQMTAADEVARQAATATLALERATLAGEQTTKAIRDCEYDIERLREELAEAELALVAAQMEQRTAEAAVAAAKQAADEAQARVPDRAALRQRLAALEAKNEQVRANVRKREMLEQATAKKTESEALTKRLAAIETEKAERLAKATFPVKELGLDAQGVTWNGLPFAQASTAVRVRASVAIGLALNPKLKVLLVRNGNDLGTKNLTLIAEMAQAAGAQVWVERIAGGNGQATIVIEDGAVAETEMVTL